MMSPFFVAITIFILNACRGDPNIWINKTPCETQRRGVCVSTARSDWKCPFTGGGSSPFGCPAKYVCCIPSQRSRARRIVPGGCGLPPLFSSGSANRIVGGFQVKLGELPWQAMLTFEILKMGQTYRPICAGAIIHKYWILTAASCLSLGYPIVYYDITTLRLVTGVVNIHNIGNNNFKNIQMHRIDKVLIHHQFRMVRGLQHNIALVKLQQPIKFDNFSQPVCLPNWNENLENTICTVSSWGPPNATYIEFDVSPTLVGLNIPVINGNTCAKLFREQWGDEVLHESEMCAGFLSADRSKCVGDMGAPLACRMNNGQYILGGFAAWDRRCGVGNLPGVIGKMPGVYTKVASYVKWIENKTGIEFPK